MEIVKDKCIRGVHKKSNKKGYPYLDRLSKWIEKTLQDDSLDGKIKKQVLETSLLWAADFSGKLRKRKHNVVVSCEFVSEAALSALTNGDAVAYTHEHVIPKNVIRDWILANRTLSACQIENLLRMSVYCLVTKDEDTEKLGGTFRKTWLADTQTKYGLAASSRWGSKNSRRRHCRLVSLQGYSR